MQRVAAARSFDAPPPPQPVGEPRRSKAERRRLMGAPVSAVSAESEVAGRELTSRNQESDARAADPAERSAAAAAAALPQIPPHSTGGWVTAALIQHGEPI